MSASRTIAVAAVVVAALAAAPVAATDDAITYSTYCDQDRTGCTTTDKSLTSGTTWRTAGPTTKTKATSVKCIADAYTCIGTTTYADSSCGTSATYGATVCNVCVTVDSSESMMLSCTKGSTDAQLVYYTAASDCTGSSSYSDVTAACTQPVRGYMKVTKAAFGCNVVSEQGHSTAECSSDVVTNSISPQNECAGATSGSKMAKVSCPGNDDADSASSAVSALAAALVAVLCAVA